MGIRRYCRKCGTYKPEGEFYASDRSTCKACICLRVKAHRMANIERIREYDRGRGNRQPPTYLREYRRRNPEKYIAHRILRRAVLSGKVKPLPCSVCGEKAEAHHPDYSAPLDVVWLCPAHHKQLHAQERKAA